MNASKIKIGVIGCGHWGPNIVRNLQNHPRCSVIQVVDASRERLAAIRNKYSEILVSEYVDELLNNADVDAVVICTPTITHYDLTRKALEAGKNVFVEKPLATSVEHCNSLIRIAHNNKLVLFVGHIFVYNAGIQAVKNIISNNELGNIYYINIVRTNLGPIRNDVSSLWDLAPHDISILKYWFGRLPVKVSAVGGCYLNRSLEDVIFASYFFDDGLMANLHVSWLSPKKIREIVVVGEKKMLIWDDMDLNHPIKIYDKKAVVDTTGCDIDDTYIGFRAEIHEGDTHIPRIVMNEPLATECNAFISSIDKPSMSMSTGEDGRDVVNVLCATNVSIKESGKQIFIKR